MIDLNVQISRYSYPAELVAVDGDIVTIRARVASPEVISMLQPIEVPVPDRLIDIIILAGTTFRGTTYFREAPMSVSSAWAEKLLESGEARLVPKPPVELKVGQEVRLEWLGTEKVTKATVLARSRCVRGEGYTFQIGSKSRRWVYTADLEAVNGMANYFAVTDGR